MQSEHPLQQPADDEPTGIPSRAEDPAQPGHVGLLDGRLHPLTLVFSVWRSVRGLLIPAIPLLVFGGRLTGVFVLGGLFAVTMARAMARYFSFTYRIEQGELVTQQGIMERTERHIPLERVQEIRIEQGVLHRVFGVVDAIVETAGGQGPEATLSVLSREEAERLREAVFARAKTRAARSHDPSETLRAETDVRRLGLKDLVVAGVTSNHFVSALVVVGGLWAFIDDIFPESVYERIAEGVYGYASSLMEQGVERAIVVAVVGVLAVMLIGILFSVAGTVIVFYGFTFSRAGEDLQRQYGLLTRRASSLPRRRIQVVEIEQKPLRRLFGLVTLRADTVGTRNRESDDRNKGRDVLIPVMPLVEVESMLPVLFPDLESGPRDWRKVSRRAIARGTIKGGLVCIGLTAATGAWYQSPAAFLLLLLLLPAVYAINVLRYRTLGYSIGERYFYTRRGWFGRSTHIVPINKLQAVEVRQTPLDRRLDLATITVDTAGQAYTGGGPRISNVPLGEARALAVALSTAASRTIYRL